MYNKLYIFINQQKIVKLYKEANTIPQNIQWKCRNCGEINESYYLNCMTCASFRKVNKRKQKIVRLTSS